MRKAREVGVMMQYELGGADLLKALGNISSEVYNDLARANFFEPEVRQHHAFKLMDCSTLVQEALTKTKVILSQQAGLEDRQHSGRRTHPESLAEVSTMGCANGRRSGSRPRSIKKLFL